MRLDPTSVRQRAAIVLGLVSLALVATWSGPWWLPLQWLVVVAHEGAHVLGCVATGGQVVEVVWGAADADAGWFVQPAGETHTLGGAEGLLLAMGFFGPLVVAGLALLASRGASKRQRPWLAALAVLVCVANAMDLRDDWRRLRAHEPVDAVLLSDRTPVGTGGWFGIWGVSTLAVAAMGVASLRKDD
jgi:hypothetical protein